jgi:hypothetical protein
MGGKEPGQPNFSRFSPQIVMYGTKRIGASHHLQWILTATSDYIRENPLVGNLYSLAQEANAKLNDFKRPSTDAYQQLGNLLSVDYIETSPLLKILELEGYSDRAFVEEEVEPQSQWTAGAKVGLGVGLVISLCGCCCICKWCKGRNEEQNIRSATGAADKNTHQQYWIHARNHHTQHAIPFYSTLVHRQPLVVAFH